MVIIIIDWEEVIVNVSIFINCKLDVIIIVGKGVDVY